MFAVHDGKQRRAQPIGSSRRLLQRPGQSADRETTAENSASQSRNDVRGRNFHTNLEGNSARRLWRNRESRRRSPVTEANGSPYRRVQRNRAGARRFGKPAGKS